MKKIIVLLLFVLPLGAFAQSGKIAFVNSEEIFLAMPELSAVETKMADLTKQYEGELTQMQDEYKKKFTDLMAQQDSLSDNIKLRRQQEVQDIQERIENMYTVAQQDMAKQQQEMIEPIRKKVADAIKQVGDEQKFDYIIDIQNLLYKSQVATDATPLVKAKLGLK